ncbi:uncharacterized protein LOC126992776 [Eriocheir sinensis]|uniref:uncharacterized protein LOC126992776 n=1 Tax=Eriocheir sinensis TaxID=95602 RepID=UPI0021C95C0D|nr:uncharacterized protein LOC126992776 [Eriocheir sinensis]
MALQILLVVMAMGCASAASPPLTLPIRSSSGNVRSVYPKGMVLLDPIAKSCDNISYAPASQNPSERLQLTAGENLNTLMGFPSADGFGQVAFYICTDPLNPLCESGPDITTNYSRCWKIGHTQFFIAAFAKSTWISALHPYQIPIPFDVECEGCVLLTVGRQTECLTCPDTSYTEACTYISIKAPEKPLPTTTPEPPTTTPPPPPPTTTTPPPPTTTPPPPPPTTTPPPTTQAPSPPTKAEEEFRLCQDADPNQLGPCPHHPAAQPPPPGNPLSI